MRLTQTCIAGIMIVIGVYGMVGVAADLFMRVRAHASLPISLAQARGSVPGGLEDWEMTLFEMCSVSELFLNFPKLDTHNVASYLSAQRAT
jgi:hypothetical protein